MLTRFAAGSFVACIAIALASAGALIFSGLNPQRFALILAIWCLVPCVWGLWAMLSPSGWVPRRLPVWGLFLGVVAGVMVMYALNLPARVFGIVLSNTTKVFGILIAALVYYLLWMLVRAVYRSILTPGPAPSKA